jgi:anthranilate/para-aminobenzoate synthase component I
LILRRLPFVPAEPLGLWPALHPNPRHGFILGSGAGTVRDHIIFMSAFNPARVVSAQLHEPQKVFRFLTQISNPRSHNLPRFVGYFGFSAGRWFDPALARLPQKPDPLKFPTAFWGDYRNVVKFDLLKKQTTIVAENKKEAERIVAVLKNVPSSVPPSVSSGRRVGGVFQQRSLSEFTAMVREAKAAIAAGDIYQANLSSRFERKFDGKPVELYRYLAVSNPSPYAAMLKMGEQWIVSASPELLVSLQGRALRTRPIAGTRPRGKDRKEDKKKSGQLLLSPKERAEHIMLVDLERNDLGRIAEAGSVRVTERFVVERYSHVMHIVSEVVGRLRKNLSAVDALRALFPGGTISGCPKYRSIEIIENLEGIARGPFMEARAL